MDPENSPPGQALATFFLEAKLQGMDPERNWLVKIEGVPLLRQTAEKWDQISGFQARPDDLLICTFPKSGTSWIQEIVDIILHGGDLQKCDQLPIYERSPFIELFLPKPVVSGIDEAEAMPSPRVLKTHLQARLLPPSFWKQNCKIIYLARNVKDNAVSAFNFQRMNQLVPDPGDWDNFLKDFIAGECRFGSWFDHVCGWWEAKDHHPILYLFYEDMKEDPAQEIRKVAEFLGFELTELILNQIVQHTSFNSMKANAMTNFTTLPSSILDHSVSPYMRKGRDKMRTPKDFISNILLSLLLNNCDSVAMVSGLIGREIALGTVGDWKKHFTMAQSEWLDTICAQKLKDGPSFRTQL